MKEIDPRDIKLAIDPKFPSDKAIAGLREKLNDMKAEIDGHIRTLEFMEEIQQIKNQLLN
jgi:hypothetical protein